MRTIAYCWYFVMATALAGALACTGSGGGGAAGGASGDTWPQLVGVMTKIQNSFPAAPSSLPACAPEAGRGHALLAFTSVARFATGGFVNEDRGIPTLWNDLDEHLVSAALNQYNPASSKATYSRELLALKGFAVARAASWTDPGEQGAGQVDGHVVMFDTAGVPECQVPFHAVNSATTSAVASGPAVQEMGAYVSPEARVEAWRSDLGHNVCSAIDAAIPVVRREASERDRTH